MTGQVTVQLLEERLENFREVSSVLLDEFGGRFLNVLNRANGYLYLHDGQGLVQLLVTKFPRSFGDWPMAKLANVIQAGTWKTALQLLHFLRWTNTKSRAWI